ncbi:hypothetical protein Tco_1096296 [Tanacetum coccineum]
MRHPHVFTILLLLGRIYNVYGVGVSSNEVEIMASYTGCEAGFFRLTYLGLPIGSNISRIANWQPLIDRLRLDYRVGRPIFSPLVAALLSSNISEDSKKFAWVKWSNILDSLDKRGLSVHVVKVIHGDEASIDIRGCRINGVWASIARSIFYLHSSGIVPLNSIRFKSRPVNVGRTKVEFDALSSDIANLEPEELLDSGTCIWSLSHNDKFSVNSVRKHIDDLSLPSLSPSTRRCKIIPGKDNIFM